MRVDLQEIEPGMRLARSVYNLEGELLLKQGEVITPDHLLLFRTWGVGQFEVEGSGEGEERIEGEVAEEVESIFSSVEKTEVVEEIKGAAKRIRANRRKG